MEVSTMKISTTPTGTEKKDEYERPEIKAILVKDVIVVSGQSEQTEQQGGSPVSPIENGGGETFP